VATQWHAERLRGVRPRATASGKALVCGIRGCNLSKVLNLIGDEKPDYVVVVGADHVYRMDFQQMLEAHIASGAKVTVAGIRQPKDLSDQFGVIQVDPEDPHPDS
jgi:ADP-glucose pyrophosphorylase